MTNLQTKGPDCPAPDYFWNNMGHICGTEYRRKNPTNPQIFIRRRNCTNKCPAADPAHVAFWSTQPMSATRVLYVSTLTVPPSNPWLMVLLFYTLFGDACSPCMRKKYISRRKKRKQNHPRLLRCAAAAAAKQAPLHSEDRAPHYSLPYLPDHESTSASAGCYRYSPSFFGGEVAQHSVHSTDR